MRTRLLTSTGLGLALVALAPQLALAEIASLVVLDGPAPLGGYTYAKFESIDVSDNPGRTVLRSSVKMPSGPPVTRASHTIVPLGLIDMWLRRDSDPPPGSAWPAQETTVPGPELLRAKMQASRFGATVVEVTVAKTATVARAGDPFPGGGFINHPSYPVATNTQGVVFKPYLRQVAEEFDEALARCVGGDGNCSSGGTGTLEVLALKSDPIPDRPGRRLCDFREFDASDFGIVFVADTKTDCEGPGSPKVGVFRKAFGGSLVTLAIEGETSATGTVLGASTTGRGSETTASPPSARTRRCLSCSCVIPPRARPHRPSPPS